MSDELSTYLRTRLEELREFLTPAEWQMLANVRTFAEAERALMALEHPCHICGAPRKLLSNTSCEDILRHELAEVVL